MIKPLDDSIAVGSWVRYKRTGKTSKVIGFKDETIVILDEPCKGGFTLNGNAYNGFIYKDAKGKFNDFFELVVPDEED